MTDFNALADSVDEALRRGDRGIDGAATADALREAAGLQAKLDAAEADRRATPDGPCYYCGKLTNSLAGNPSEWSVMLCHADEPGKVKYHHVKCVSDRLARLAECERDAQLGKLVRAKLVSGNKIPMERCVILAKEVAAIDALQAHKEKG